MKKFLSILCLLALTVGLVPGAAAESPVALQAQGWYETICAELTGVADGDVAAVSYIDAEGVETALAGQDFDFLVRDMDGGVRIDIPGVKAGTYDLSVKLKDGRGYVALGLEVKAYDRSGFAHKVHTTDDSGAITGIVDYTEGVGAYNDDGTLKENAQVIYVTDANKNTVTAEFTRFGDPKVVTGIGNILNSNNSKINLGFLEFSSKENHRPVVVRFLGTVTAPEGVSDFKAGSSNGSMVYMLSGANITLEGIGPDATIYGWGISFGADKDDTQYDKQARNFEVRNLAFKEVPEDCLEIAGFGNSDGSIKEPVKHSWVHNCAFYRPSDIANPAESDKVQGDGSMDFKFGEYMTMSYNYFERNHKTSLIGGSDANQQYHVTWHHNWWKDVESRAPLCRQADVHIYNNLYDGQTSYCMSLRANSYVFSEYNTFLNCKNPVVLEKSSGSTLPVGACKSYEDARTGCTGTDQAVKVDDKATPVDSTNLYANFDTDGTLSYIPTGDYALQTDAAQAEATVRAEAGVQKRALDVTGYSAAAYGTLGDLQWIYTNEGDVIIPAGIPANATILVAGYDGGRCVKATEIKNGTATLGAGMEQGKLFWLDAQCAPQCPAAGWGEAQG